MIGEYTLTVNNILGNHVAERMKLFYINNLLEIQL